VAGFTAGRSSVAEIEIERPGDVIAISAGDPGGRPQISHCEEAKADQRDVLKIWDLDCAKDTAQIMFTTNIRQSPTSLNPDPTASRPDRLAIRGTKRQITLRLEKHLIEDLRRIGRGDI
jgi:uncharacterized protein (DUF4415 family)